MRFSAEDFKRLYAEMPDEELRSLVREELTEIARPCYDEELKRRGLHAATVRRAIQPVAARAALQSAAIPAFPEDDTTAGGGFRLLVPVSYVDQAREALGEAGHGSVL